MILVMSPVKLVSRRTMSETIRLRVVRELKDR